MTGHDFTAAELVHVAGLCRTAHDLILTEGWQRGSGVDHGLCLGNALGKADGVVWRNESAGHKYVWYVSLNPEVLCRNGRIFQAFASALTGEAATYRWNDAHDRTEDDVLGLLLDTEKAIRDELGA